MKKPGTAPDLLVRDWVPIEVHDLAVLSTGHARGLRLGGSRDPPAAFGVWRVTVWNAMVFE